MCSKAGWFAHFVIAWCHRLHLKIQGRIVVKLATSGCSTRSSACPTIPMCFLELHLWLQHQIHHQLHPATCFWKIYSAILCLLLLFLKFQSSNSTWGFEKMFSVERCLDFATIIIPILAFQLSLDFRFFWMRRCSTSSTCFFWTSDAEQLIGFPERWWRKKGEEKGEGE